MTLELYFDIDQYTKYSDTSNQISPSLKPQWENKHNFHSPDKNKYSALYYYCTTVRQSKKPVIVVVAGLILVICVPVTPANREIRTPAISMSH